MKDIYLDYSSTTYVKDEVLKEMIKYYKKCFYNPSSLYGNGIENKINKSRNTIAKYINAKDNEIFFTSCGSESDNWALKGVVFANKNKGNHIITTKIEHHAILHTCEFLEKNGYEVTYLDVDEEGFIDLDELKNAITDKTILVSVMFANNEIGTIQPIKEIGKICRDNGILFHTDAVQSIGHIPIDVNDMNIDLLSFSGHKIYAPKGIGCLYIRNNVKIDNLIHGGKQEDNKRGGTENVSSIIGLEKAIQILDNKHINYDRNYILFNLLKEIPNCYLNGAGNKEINKLNYIDYNYNYIIKNRLDNNINIRFDGIENEALVLNLQLKGIKCSVGSACNSGSLETSHVLKAIGLTNQQANNSIRLSLGDKMTKENMDYVINTIKDTVYNLRNM